MMKVAYVEECCWRQRNSSIRLDEAKGIQNVTKRYGIFHSGLFVSRVDQMRVAFFWEDRHEDSKADSSINGNHI
jgi:ureidoglycolate hydrolase